MLHDLAEEPSPMASGLNELAGDCETLAGSIEKLLVAGEGPTTPPVRVTAP